MELVGPGGGETTAGLGGSAGDELERGLEAPAVAVGRDELRAGEIVSVADVQLQLFQECQQQSTGNEVCQKQLGKRTVNRVYTVYYISSRRVLEPPQVSLILLLTNSRFAAAAIARHEIGQVPGQLAGTGIELDANAGVRLPGDKSQRTIPVAACS